jgi:hypothetical protein
LNPVTLTPERTKATRPNWAAIGIVCLILGAAAIVMGGLWTSMEHDGWPWTGGLSDHVGSGYVEGTIAHPDGRVEVFRAATEDEVYAWMDRRNEELKHSYQLDDQIAAGHVLSPLGFGLVAVGGGVLIWGSAGAFRRRRTGTSTTASS